MDLWLLVFALVVVLPWLGFRRYRRAVSAPGPLGTAAKLRLYSLTIFSQWTLTVACVFVLRARGLGLGDLGLATVGSAAALAIALIGALALIALTVVSTRRAAREPEGLPDRVTRLIRILPSTPGQRAGFALVAITAGFCEEVLYRGFLIFAFGGVLPSAWLAAVVAGVFFGVGHAYQGRQGMLTTGTLGVFLGLLYLWSGSLWPGIALHFAIDLVNGFALGALAEDSPPVSAETAAAVAPPFDASDPGPP